MTVITRELIDQGRTDRGGWTATQINLLGLTWPPAKGWMDRVVGKEISEEDAGRFLLIGQQMRASAPMPRRLVMWDRARPQLHEALHGAFLDGRHGYSREMVLMGVPSDHFTPEESARVYAAFEAGVEARRKGVKCMCDSCLMPDRIHENEIKRREYRSRRTRELEAKGYAPAEIEKHILEEIDMGAWL